MTKRLAAAAPVVVAVALLARLSAAFLGNEFTLALVVAQGRQDAPWYYRLAGVWATAQGSLLCFAAVVGVVGWWGTRRDVGAQCVAALTTAALLAVDLLVASPFERLAVPGIAGRGLTPILEHPAMAVHPPLLYLGLASALAPFAAAVTGRLDPEVARRQLATALSVVTVAIALGAWWSYAEQGWGGYWAWDPVENASFAAWLATLMSLHALPRSGDDTGTRWSLAFAGVPWVVVLLGAASSRSGVVPSVHGFAEAAAVGTGLAALAVAAAMTLLVRLVKARAAEPLSRRATDLPVVLAAAVLVIVAVGIATPFVARALGHEIHVSGRFYARLLLPFGVATVTGLALLALRGRAGLPASVWLAHGGFAVLLLAALVSTGDRSATATLAPGETATLAGWHVEHLGVRVEPGPRTDTEAVVADLVLDGTLIHPALVAYPVQGGVLPETVLVPGVVADAQAVLVRADDDGRALYEIRRKPGVNGVWLGAACVAAGAGLSRRRRRRTPSDPPASPASVPATR